MLHYYTLAYYVTLLHISLLCYITTHSLIMLHYYTLAYYVTLLHIILLCYITTH